MTKLFVDTSFFIALLIESDDLHEAARALAAQTLTDQRITSEPVITELLDDFGDRGALFQKDGPPIRRCTTR